MTTSNIFVTLAAAIATISLCASAQLSAATIAPPAAPATRFLDEAGGRIAYDDWGGDGPLVVCVPGMGDVRAQYRFLAPALKGAGFRVVTMDVRGLGESSVEWPDYSAAAVGSDIVALIRRLDAKRAFVIGNSMAAAAAVWAAAEIPDRIGGIVLIGPFVRDVPTSWATEMLIKVVFMRPWGVTAWSHYYASLYPTSPPVDLESYRAALSANLSEAGRFDALRAMLAASKAPCDARIPQVKAPALVVMGTRDPDFSDPGVEAKLVTERLHGELMMVDGAGHYPHVEMPSAAAPRIIRFLNANGVSDGRKSGT